MARAAELLGHPVRLRLLGGPGAASDAADHWRAAAEAADVRLTFSGVLAAERLSHELQALDVYLHADPAGPTCRRGSLAAALAHGSAVVALSGAEADALLTDSGALRVAPLDDLASALADVLADPALRADLGRRARRLYGSALSLEVAVPTLVDALALPDGERR